MKNYILYYNCIKLCLIYVIIFGVRAYAFDIQLK